MALLNVPGVKARADVGGPVIDAEVRSAQPQIPVRQILAGGAARVLPTQALSMDKMGFEEVDGIEIPRVVANNFAGEKSGKTHWAFTAPPPIAVISFDTGTEMIAKKFRRQGKRILYKFHDVDLTSKDQGRHEREWEHIKASFESIVNNKDVRTGIIDTGTEMWELCRLARFGKLTQVMPHHYGPVNNEFRDLIKMSYDRPDLNMIWIHKVKKEYVKKGNSDKEAAWNGKYERAGFGDMPYLVDLNIENYRRPGQADWGEGNVVFGVKVIDCRQNPDVIGLQIGAEGDLQDRGLSWTGVEGDFSTFSSLASLIYADHPEAQHERYWK